jgi:hypothetical protein
MYQSTNPSYHPQGVADAQTTAISNDLEPHVEVTYNGSTFFVPESTAYMYDPAYNPDANPNPDHTSYSPLPGDENNETAALEESMSPPAYEIEWTTPAPQRRTLAASSIPANIHDYFQMLDHETLRQMEPDDER